MPKIRAKYTEKNDLIDKCDEAFDKADASINELEAEVNKELDALEEVIKKLNAVSPINIPTGKSADPETKNFVALVGKKLKEANDLRDKLEKEEEDIANAKDKLMATVQPLNEIAERDVKTPEIKKVLDGLKDVNRKLDKSKDNLKDLFELARNLNDDVNEMLEGDKDRKIGEADKKLAELDAVIDDLNDKRADAIKKLGAYQDLIERAKEDPGKSDPKLLDKIKKLEGEAKLIGKDLKDIDEKLADIKRKRNDSAKLLDEMKTKPDKFTPQQIDGLLQQIAD